MSLYGIDNTVDEAKDPYFKELLDKGAKRAWESTMKKTIPRVSSFQSGAKLLRSLNKKGV